MRADDDAASSRSDGASSGAASAGCEPYADACSQCRARVARRGGPPPRWWEAEEERIHHGGAVTPLELSVCDVRAAANSPGRPVVFHAHGVVYLAPRSLLEDHPGGIFSLTSHAGCDVENDFQFHSRGGQASWKR
jgi:hypothetical protein